MIAANGSIHVLLASRSSLEGDPPWTFQVVVSICVWLRTRGQPWSKVEVPPITLTVEVPDTGSDLNFGGPEIAAAIETAVGAPGFKAEVRIERDLPATNSAVERAFG